MIREQGIVEGISDGRATVRMERSAACAACQSRDSCREAAGGEMTIEIANELAAREGDRVEISIGSGSFLTLSLMVYLAPVAALIAGAVAGAEIGRAVQMNATALAIAGGLVGIGGAFYVLRRFDRSVRGRKDFGPRMTRIVRRSGPNPSPMVAAMSETDTAMETTVLPSPRAEETDPKP